MENKSKEQIEIDQKNKKELVIEPDLCYNNRIHLSDKKDGWEITLTSATESMFNLLNYAGQVKKLMFEPARESSKREIPKGVN